MYRFTGVFLIMMCAGLGLSQHALAAEQLDIHDGSAITITSPQNGATVESAFDLAYSFRKGMMADHVHVFLDGEYQKGFKGKFSDVPRGPHTITVKVATHDHDMVTVSDSVEVMVK